MLFDTSSSRGDRTETSGRTLACDLQPLIDAERYWRSLGQEGQPPRRRDIDPARLGQALSTTLILERVAPGMARVRLSGQGANHMLGMDLRGMPASVLVSPTYRQALGAQIEAVFAGPAIVEVPLKLPRTWGRRPVSARLLLLPMTDDLGLVTRALGVIASAEEVPSGGQHRFEVDEVGAFRCTLIAPVHAPRPQRRRTDGPVERSVAMAVAPQQTDAPDVRSITDTPPRSHRRFELVAGGLEGPRPEDDPRPALRLVVSNP